MIDEAIILASGYGTRLRPLTDYVNKVALPVGGRPWITYVLDMLHSWGIKHVVLKVAYKWNTIYEVLGHHYNGMNVNYVITEMPLGTGNDLQMALHYVRSQKVLAMNGDSLYKIDYQKFYEECQHEPFALAIMKDEHGNADIGPDGYITRFSVEPSNLPYKNGGIYIIDKDKFQIQTASLEEALAKGQLRARGYIDNGFFIDMGTPITYGLAQLLVPKEAEEYKRLDKNAKGNRRMGTKAVILDMDGTLIVLKPFIRDPKDIEFIEPTLSWVRKQQDLGYKILVATNQGEIALGHYTEEEFWHFTDVMLSMLEDRGIYIDRVYYCPHHPEGIIPEYTKDCDCRKPKPGMLLQAIRDYDIDVSQSYFIGDKQTDIDAGQAAGLHTKWVHEIW